MRGLSIGFGSILFVLLGWGVSIAGPSLKVTPNKNQMSVTEYLVLDIEFEVEGGGTDPTLQPPALKDWERIRVESSGTQQSIRIINGSISRSFSKRERWILKPLNTGRLPIGSFELVGANGRVRTPVRHVRVRDAASDSAQRAQRAPPVRQMASQRQCYKRKGASWREYNSKAIRTREGFLPNRPATDRQPRAKK